MGGGDEGGRGGSGGGFAKGRRGKHGYPIQGVESPSSLTGGNKIGGKVALMGVENRGHEASSPKEPIIGTIFLGFEGKRDGSGRGAATRGAM